MKFKIIDKCCNEYIESEIKQSDIEKVIYLGACIEIAPAKKGHSIIVHPDNTIEYIATETQHSS